MGLFSRGANQRERLQAKRPGLVRTLTKAQDELVRLQGQRVIKARPEALTAAKERVEAAQAALNALDDQIARS